MQIGDVDPTRRNFKMFTGYWRHHKQDAGWVATTLLKRSRKRKRISIEKGISGRPLLFPLSHPLRVWRSGLVAWVNILLYCHLSNNVIYIIKRKKLWQQESCKFYSRRCGDSSATSTATVVASFFITSRSMNWFAESPPARIFGYKKQNFIVDVFLPFGTSLGETFRMKNAQKHLTRAWKPTLPHLRQGLMMIPPDLLWKATAHTTAFGMRKTAWIFLSTSWRIITEWVDLP